LETEVNNGVKGNLEWLAEDGTDDLSHGGDEALVLHDLLISHSDRDLVEGWSGRSDGDQSEKGNDEFHFFSFSWLFSKFNFDFFLSLLSI
jgi:hypothetical protein